MRTIIAVFLSLLFFGCQSGGPDPSKTTEQLKEEVLSAACSDEMKREFEEAITSQSKTLNDNQLRKSIANMKTNLKCAK